MKKKTLGCIGLVVGCVFFGILLAALISFHSGKCSANEYREILKEIGLSRLENQQVIDCGRSGWNKKWYKLILPKGAYLNLSNDLAVAGFSELVYSDSLEDDFEVFRKDATGARMAYSSIRKNNKLYKLYFDAEDGIITVIVYNLGR